jgi:hypothetical protein
VENEKSEHAKAVEGLMDQGAKRSAPPSQGQDRMLQFFRYEHLPEHLRAVSAPFGTLALQITENLPSNPERTVALRKLLEAKDAAVRCVLFEA